MGAGIFVLFTNISQAPRIVPSKWKMLNKYVKINHMKFYSSKKWRNGKG